ncbi:MAG: hypothetical protein ACTHOB_11165 [Ginsengibacter sp.]
MNYSKIILALFILTLFVSCDPGSTIKYEIVNTTNQPVKVKYQFVSNASGDTSAQEAIINSKSNKIINQEPALGYVTQYDERHDSMFLYWLTIEQQNKLTHQNFKDKKYWKLEKKNNQDATYKLIVDTSLFDKY